MQRLLLTTGIAAFALWAFAGCMKTENPATPVDISIPVLPAYVWQGDGVPCGDPMGYTLIAGQHYDAGFITVTLTDGELCIDIQTTGGWVLTETHVAVAPHLDSIPQTGSGNPQVGKFLWETEHDPAVTSFTYCCNPLEYLWEAGEIYIAVHASVLLLDDAGNPIQEETAWGEGPEFPGRSWATYMNYLVESCPECELVVTYPNGGEEFCLDSTVSIIWEFTGDSPGTVLIELLQSGEVCQIIADSAPNNGLFEWVAAGCSFPDGYAVRVTDLGCGATDDSDGPFGLVDCSPEEPPVISVVQPNVGDLLCVNEGFPIVWTIDGGAHATVRIELLFEGAVCDTIFEGAPTPDGSGGYEYLWVAEACNSLTDGYQIRITDVETDAYDDSDTPFIIDFCGSGGEKR
ncbi:MAG: hypothetical protein ABIK65_09540 [Candidatus Eisenbacteria bacterium]